MQMRIAEKPKFVKGAKDGRGHDIVQRLCLILVPWQTPEPEILILYEDPIVVKETKHEGVHPKKALGVKECLVPFR